jgi:organic hydroperoxide reductase OsmC/OhrA
MTTISELRICMSLPCNDISPRHRRAPRRTAVWMDLDRSSYGSGRRTPHRALVNRTVPSIAGDPPGKTTPELLAASHAACYGIGLRSLIERKGGRAKRVTVEATISAQKGPDGIQIQSSHLNGVVEGLEKLDDVQLHDISREVADGCTISLALRGVVRITHEVKAEGSSAPTRY